MRARCSLCLRITYCKVTLQHKMPKTAVITGGARGFGRAFGEYLLEQGYQVVLLDVLTDQGIETARQLNLDHGAGSVLFIQCDVCDKVQFKYAFDRAVSVYGGVDVMVNNAGINGHALYERVVDVNLNAVIYGCQLAVEHMGTDHGGRGGLIVNISSTAGLTVAPFEPVYSAAKHGVVGLSRSLGVAMEPAGVRVVCLCPSFTRTDMTKELVEGSRREKVVGDIGIMEVPDVVRAFGQLFRDQHPASVMAVTPKGAVYKFPKKLKEAKL